MSTIPTSLLQFGHVVIYFNQEFDALLDEDIKKKVEEAIYAAGFAPDHFSLNEREARWENDTHRNYISIYKHDILTNEEVINALLPFVV